MTLHEGAFPAPARTAQVVPARANARTPRQATTRRRKWQRVHRWLGIVLGVWFTLVGATGSLLVFEEPIDAWLNPLLLTTTSTGEALAPERVEELATLEHDLGRVEKIHMPAAQGDVYRLTLRVSPTRRVGSERIEAMFDPVTGRLLGTRKVEGIGFGAPNIMKTLYEFHRNVLLGSAGSNIVGIAGFLLLASAITGLVVALPRKLAGLKRLVWINARASNTRVMFDVHRSTSAVHTRPVVATSHAWCVWAFANPSVIVLLRGPPHEGSKS